MRDVHVVKRDVRLVVPYLNPIEFSKGSKGFRVWIKISKQLIPTEKNKIDKSGT